MNLPYSSCPVTNEQSNIQMKLIGPNIRLNVDIALPGYSIIWDS